MAALNEILIKPEYRPCLIDLKDEKEIKWSMLRCLPALVNIEGNIRAEVIGNIYDNPELVGGNNGD